MRYREIDYREACRQQSQLAASVCIKRLGEKPKTIAGLDVAYDVKQGVAYAAAMLFSYPGLELLKTSFTTTDVDFPYIPGLLSFRESPPLLKALHALNLRPDVLLVDGQGICHPRRLGLASHLGVISGIPSIGAAKSHLCGEYEEPNRERGAGKSIILGGEVVGCVLRTRTSVRPLFISPGHLCNLEECIEIVLMCCKRYRLPEPQRVAHHMAEKAKREGIGFG